MRVTLPDPPPDPAAITLAQARANHWYVTGNCARCRCLRGFSRYTGRHETTPLEQLWREGKLVCAVHRTPLDGLAVDAGGNMMVGPRYVARWFKPGHWPDPELETRWREPPQEPSPSR